MFSNENCTILAHATFYILSATCYNLQYAAVIALIGAKLSQLQAARGILKRMARGS